MIVGNSAAAEELAAVLDSSVSIECVATGSPLPQLNWLRNGLPLPVSSHIRLLSAGQVLRYVSRQCAEDEFLSFEICKCISLKHSYLDSGCKISQIIKTMSSLKIEKV